jgi:3-phenylpropionate/trans-cinnamate dioxygenase ferredoxin reductase subunit
MTGPEVGCVVIGAGLTAAHVIGTLRERGYDAPISLIGNEGEPPYERPPLSKGYLQGSSAVEKIYPHPESWYRAQQVALHLDDGAAAIDRDRQLVRLGSGTELPYEQLVLATGARPRMPALPGVDLPGVLMLRTLPHGTALKERLGSERRWVIIGGGWIGLEVAAAARGAGDPVTVLEAADLPLGHILGERLGQHFADLHRRHGVDLRTSATVDAVEQSGGALVVRTGQGDHPADIVVVAVGVVPNTELAADAGLAVDNGIVVDGQLRTSDPHILAAGDVANAHHETLGPLRVEHWDNAIRQGKLAAATLLGSADRYDWQPYFYTDQFDLGMEYVGRNGPQDRVVVRGDMDSGEFIAFWLDADEVVTAAMNVNIWDVNEQLRAIVGRRVDPHDVSDPGVTLADL